MEPKSSTTQGANSATLYLPGGATTDTNIAKVRTYYNSDVGLMITLPIGEIETDFLTHFCLGTVTIGRATAVAGEYLLRPLDLQFPIDINWCVKIIECAFGELQTQNSVQNFSNVVQALSTRRNVFLEFCFLVLATLIGERIEAPQQHQNAVLVGVYRLGSVLFICIAHDGENFYTSEFFDIDTARVNGESIQFAPEKVRPILRAELSDLLNLEASHLQALSSGKSGLPSATMVNMETSSD